MEELIYYISKDGNAFESERLCNAYDKTLEEYRVKYKGKEERPDFFDYLTKVKKRKFQRFASTIWGKIPPIKSSIRRIAFYRAGYISGNGVYMSKDFVNPLDAQEYEELSQRVDATWREFMRENAPEDLLYEYTDDYIEDIWDYHWISWTEERPRPNSELVIFERKGNKCIISYDIFNGENFVKTYHLDIIGWRYKLATDPPNDAWELFQEENHLKENNFSVYRKK